MGIALGLAVIALGVILVVHREIPTHVVPYTVAAGAVLIALGVAVVALSIRLWRVFGGPVSPPE